MFVSGLPEVNSYLHAGEVASASLELLDSIKVRQREYKNSKNSEYLNLFRHSL